MVTTECSVRTIRNARKQTCHHSLSCRKRIESQTTIHRNGNRLNSSWVERTEFNLFENHHLLKLYSIRYIYILYWNTVMCVNTIYCYLLSHFSFHLLKIRRMKITLSVESDFFLSFSSIWSILRSVFVLEFRTNNKQAIAFKQFLYSKYTELVFRIIINSQTNYSTTVSSRSILETSIFTHHWLRVCWWSCCLPNPHHPQEEKG